MHTACSPWQIGLNTSKFSKTCIKRTKMNVTYERWVTEISSMILFQWCLGSLSIYKYGVFARKPHFAHLLRKLQLLRLQVHLASFMSQYWTSVFDYDHEKPNRKYDWFGPFSQSGECFYAQIQLMQCRTRSDDELKTKLCHSRCTLLSFSLEICFSCICG